MPRRRIIIAAVTVLALFAIAILAWTLLADDPLTLRIVNIKESPEVSAKIVTVRLGNDSSKYVALPRQQKFQVLLPDGWQQVEELPEPSADHLSPKTSTSYCVLAVPAKAERCRFILDYRVGSPPYCDALFFCNRHSLLRHMPTLSRAVINLFPRQARTRHLTIELPLTANVPHFART
jgi:hypothetical protein